MPEPRYGIVTIDPRPLARTPRARENAAGKRKEPALRIESSVTSLSWIPLGAMEGAGTELAFRFGIAHYDPPPPEVLEDLEALRAADRFRFANVLRAWIEVDDDGRIVDYGHAGGGQIGRASCRERV